MILSACGNDDDDNDFLNSNGKIVFVSDRDGNEEIYVRNADGSSPVMLTTNHGGPDHSPSWSPDGTMIAFHFISHTRRSSVDIPGVYVVNADGSDPVQPSGYGPELSPSWSPDGTMIAFGSSRDGNFDIYVVNADGSDPVNLTNNPRRDDAPSWSPDGTKIVSVSNLVSNRDGSSEEIYVMNADGSNPVNLTNNPAIDKESAWSPVP